MMGVSPNKLMFNREISNKLPSTPTISQAKHHREARNRDRETKEQTKKTHYKKHRTRMVDIKEGTRSQPPPKDHWSLHHML